MKKKSSPIKVPLPKLHSDQEKAEYFELHSVAEVWDQLSESQPVKLNAALAKSIGARRTQAKSPVSLGSPRRQARVVHFLQEFVTDRLGASGAPPHPGPAGGRLKV